MEPVGTRSLGASAVSTALSASLLAIPAASEQESSKATMIKKGQRDPVAAVPTRR